MSGSADALTQGESARPTDIADVLEGRSRWHVVCGDNRVVLATMPDACVDAIVCDPPYELTGASGKGGFMGKAWDATGIAYNADLWREVLRVLKPGGHLVAFGGTRTYHRMTCAIEDAGFEVRDCLAWMYGSGFPKSLNVSKAIDKAAGAEREVVGRRKLPGTARIIGGSGSATSGRTDEAYAKAIAAGKMRDELEFTAPSTSEAKQWDGWGTALKPAFEPIVLARKPFKSTVVANVLAHGTGAINIEGCRIGHDSTRRDVGSAAIWGNAGRLVGGSDAGRWPANVLLSHGPNCVCVGQRQVERRLIDATANVIEGDGRFGKMAGSKSLGTTTETIDVWECEPDCPVRLLDEQSGKLTSGANNVRRKQHDSMSMAGSLGGPSGVPEVCYGDSGGASRFFYTSKASTAERERGLEHRRKRKVNDGRAAPADNPRLRGETERANTHPTIKPIDLMRWLCRLVTPPGGVVLDPFAGSGSTIIAALAENVRGIGIELDMEHVSIALDRIVGDSPLLNRQPPPVSK